MVNLKKCLPDGTLNSSPDRYAPIQHGDLLAITWRVFITYSNRRVKTRRNPCYAPMGLNAVFST